MKQLSGFARVVTEFLKRTTLHGFKYLTSCYYYDRVLWVLVCCASTCCAGGLCRVLWARFQQRPGLLTLREMHHSHFNDIPLVICPPSELIAQTLFGLSPKSSPNAPSLSTILKHVIRKDPLEAGQGAILDQWLKEHDTNLAKALLMSSPDCEVMLTFCRWQNQRMPCGKLFYKQLTEYGACCVLNQTMLRNPSNHIELTSRLDLVLRCSNTSMEYGCEFFTMYEGEDGVLPVVLHQGLAYTAQLMFTATDSSEERLDGADDCVKIRGYSKGLCGTKCLEILCGCSHPLMPITPRTKSLPACSVEQIACLHRNHNFHEDESCSCPAPCTTYSSDLMLHSSPMEFIQYALDPIYVGLDTKISIVLQIRLRLSSSKIFALHSTESWLTLLSSLGGVFNMFLGVGLFSALEFVFFLLIKLPIALSTSTEIVAGR